MVTAQLGALPAEAAGVVQSERRVPLGPGVTDDRIIVSWDEFLSLKAKDANIRRYAVIYLAPGNGGKGTGSRKAMACEKHLKWWAQGYRPLGYVQTAPPPPRQWLKSMIEDAIALGQPIPEEMRPPGYSGPTFPLASAGEGNAPVAVAAAEGANGGAPNVELYHCTVSGCARFFDTAGGRALHIKKGHKG